MNSIEGTPARNVMVSRKWMWLAIGLAVLVVVEASYFFYSRNDLGLAEEAITMIVSTQIADIGALEENRALAETKLRRIRSPEVRGEATADVEKIFLNRQRRWGEREEKSRKIASLMQREYSDLSSLRKARTEAEDLAAELEQANETASLLSQIAEIFEVQKQDISESEAQLRNLECSSKEEKPITRDEVVGSWNLTADWNSDGTRLVFRRNGDLIYEGETAGQWSMEGGVVRFAIADYSTWIGVVSRGKIRGTASNKDGKMTTYEAIKNG